MYIPYQAKRERELRTGWPSKNHWNPSMAGCIFKYIHNDISHLTCSSYNAALTHLPWRGGTYGLSPCNWVGFCDIFDQWGVVELNAMWFLRPGHERQCSLCFVCWNTHFWKVQWPWDVHLATTTSNPTSPCGGITWLGPQTAWKERDPHPCFSLPVSKRRWEDGGRLPELSLSLTLNLLRNLERESNNYYCCELLSLEVVCYIT